jgi:glutaredoxin
VLERGRRDRPLAVRQGRIADRGPGAPADRARRLDANVQISCEEMNDITIYTTPSEFCARIIGLFEAQDLPYSLVTLKTDAELTELTERAGRKSCPLVFVGDELIGGQTETVEAVRSGRLKQLVDQP